MSVTYNFVVAKIKLKDKQNPFWKNELSEFFWPIVEWPKHLVVNIYRCEYVDRLSIVSFLFMNGLQEDLAINLIKFYSSPSKIGTPWQQRERELRSVWQRCEYIVKSGSVEQKTSYFFYCMTERKVFNYAGELKYFGRTVQPYIKPQSQLNVCDLLSQDEDLEKIACSVTAEAERDFEKRVLLEILEEIRKQH